MFRRKPRHMQETRTDEEGYGLRTLTSARLRLVAATRALVEADLAGSAELGVALGATIPPNWPPELYDREAMEYSRRQLQDPAERGWSSWYLIRTGTSPGTSTGSSMQSSAGAGHDEVVGICGFKGRPSPAGSVEIGYSVLSQHRGQGYATEAVARLVRWAFGHHNVVEVCAETLPHLQASIRVMKNNGFVLTGAGSERGVIRYAVARPDRG